MAAIISTNVVPIYITVSILILMFQLNIASIIPFINYYDELFAITLLVLFIIKRQTRIKLVDIGYFLILLSVFFIGCIGNLRTHINDHFFLMAVDALGVFKIFFTVYSIKRLISPKDCEACIKYLANILQIYIFAAALSYVLALVLDWNWMFKQVRFGFKTYGFVHGYAGDGWLGYYVEACYCIFAMRGSKLKLSKITRIICLLVAIITIKGPALLFVAFVIFYKMITSERIKTHHIIITVLIGIVVGWWYIQRYLFRAGEARAILNKTGFKIGIDYFPTGMGFATFGSDLSRDFYSLAYSMYGIDSVYGLGGHGSKAYITDNYWAMIVGELGFISTFLIAYLFYKLFRAINEKPIVSKDAKMGILAMFFSFMAGSIGSAYLTSHLGVLCFAVIGLYLCPKWNNTNISKLSNDDSAHKRRIGYV